MGPQITHFETSNLPIMIKFEQLSITAAQTWTIMIWATATWAASFSAVFFKTTSKNLSQKSYRGLFTSIYVQGRGQLSESDR